MKHWYACAQYTVLVQVGQSPAHRTVLHSSIMPGRSFVIGVSLYCFPVLIAHCPDCMHEKKGGENPSPAGELDVRVHETNHIHSSGLQCARCDPPSRVSVASRLFGILCLLKEDVNERPAYVQPNQWHSFATPTVKRHTLSSRATGPVSIQLSTDCEAPTDDAGYRVSGKDRLWGKTPCRIFVRIFLLLLL